MARLCRGQRASAIGSSRRSAFQIRPQSAAVLDVTTSVARRAERWLSLLRRRTAVTIEVDDLVGRQLLLREARHDEEAVQVELAWALANDEDYAALFLPGRRAVADFRATQVRGSFGRRPKGRVRCGLAIRSSSLLVGKRKA